MISEHARSAARVDRLVGRSIRGHRTNTARIIANCERLAIEEVPREGQPIAPAEIELDTDHTEDTDAESNRTRRKPLDE